MTELIQGDCLSEMQKIESGSVDAIITDPPYGTTACKWDSVIPFEPMWQQLNRIIKPDGAIVLFGSQPFTSSLVMSNPKAFKYEWIWEKTRSTNFLNYKINPAKKHENILVFNCKKKYYPQMEEGKKYIDKRKKSIRGLSSVVSSKMNNYGRVNNGLRFPSSIQKFKNPNNKSLHPTQKPVALMEYLIKTYTNEGETVLDFTMGSGSTGVAAKNLNRSFIGIEQDPKYFKIAEERINKPDLFS